MAKVTNGECMNVKDRQTTDACEREREFTFAKQQTELETESNMPPIATDRVAWSVVCELVCHLVRHAKMAKAIEMPFALRTRVGL